MGLISRVSSRTYRNLTMVAISAGRRSLASTLMGRGTGENVIMRFFHNTFQPNPNGYIRYNMYQVQCTNLRLSANTMVAIGVCNLLFGTWYAWKSDNFCWPKMLLIPFSGQRRLLNKYDIQINAADHSYGTWNYYPTQC